MSDIVYSELTGVFDVLAEIEAIGARVGDSIVVKPWHTEFPCSLLRQLGHSGSQWAFTESCRLGLTVPPLPTRQALRLLRTAVGHPFGTRSHHLTLLQ